MSATELLMALGGMGIRLEASGDRLRYSPRSAVTPDLAEQLKNHKSELLEILGHKADSPSIYPPDAAAVWDAALGRLESDTSFPPEVMEALRTADVYWRSDELGEPAPDSAFEALGPDGWPADCIDPDELDPCPKCGSLELWETVIGAWRCLRCDPPTTARRLEELAERIRRRTKRTTGTRQIV